MTNNKFWLVCRNIDFNETLNTKEEAIQKARHACEVNFEGNVYILEATHCFKTEPEVLKLIPKYRKKFKNGDLVKIKNHNDVFKIIACGRSFTKEYTGNFYDVKSIKDEKIYRSIKECDLMPEKSLAVKPKFKTGDIVNINVIGFQRSQFEITDVFKHKRTRSYCYSVKNIEDQDERSNGIYERFITLVERAPAPVDPKFKFGDRVLLDNYYECIVDCYIDETKSYKLSLIGGGYNVANEIRVTKK